ncbi:MAG: maleylacetoacetate isomerase [Pseudomonadales bacterium]
MAALTLYSYFRSSCSYRVRIALLLKGLPFEGRYIHLLRQGGEQRLPDYRAVNPQGLVPALEDDEGVLTQSIAIIEYLEERYPEPALLPENSRHRAYVRSLAQMLACDIQPLNNLRVLQKLKQDFNADQQQIEDWYLHWVGEGLMAFESVLVSQKLAGDCCYGNKPTLADICLVPQVYNALRFNYDLSATPRIQAIYEHCASLTAFEKAAPENQPDAE